MPTAAPYWIDFSDGSVPFWPIFARPGVIGAGSSQTVLPQLRAAGASIVYFNLYMKHEVGTLTDPLDTKTVVAKTNELFDLAVMRTGCATPRIAANELFSANVPAPWSGAAAQYRANVLTMARTLASRGARLYLLVSKPPASDSATVAWWHELASVSYFVPEVYVPANQVYSQGPVAGSRRLRVAIRRAIGRFTALDIPSSRIGVMLGFQIAIGTGGREGLEPESAWFRVVKWQALAAKQVARELPIDSIWSWGWGSWSVTTDDPDKEKAACVYLWTRKHSLCDALSVAGPDFNSSLSEGQLTFPAGARCVVRGKRLRNTQVAALTRLAGDSGLAYSALYARMIEKDQVKVPAAQVLTVERAIIGLRFGGSGASYRRALAAHGVSRAMAREIIADELRRRSIKAFLRVSKPSASAIADYYHDRGGETVRLVRADPAPAWLGGRKHGYALASLAPRALFRLASGSERSLRTALRSYRVTALGPTTTLESLPLPAVRSAIRAVLIESARDDAYARWTVVKQVRGLKRTRCVRDQMPLASPLELSVELPFLSLRGA
jgi:hypothetical protein